MRIARLLMCIAGFFQLLLSNPDVGAQVLPADTMQAKIGTEVIAQLAEVPRATVIVLFDVPRAAGGEEDVAARRRSIAAHADAVLSSLPAASHLLRRRFDNVTALVLDIDKDALAALRANPDVLRVDLDAGGHAHMTEAAPLSRVANVRRRGYVGLDVKTAVLDSGMQLAHPDFAGSIAGQQCFCSSANPATGCCPNGKPVQTGSGAAADAWGHGTNVTGIINGQGVVAPQGGAPAASVVAIRMLDANGAFYSSSDITASLDWLATHHPDTRVVNMSVGSNALFPGSCDQATAWTAAMAQAVSALAVNGTVLTASSGNQASRNSISAPACLSEVVAVGAVWDSPMGPQTMLGCTDSNIVADKPTCFTNSSSKVALYAPGAYTTSAGVGGGTSTWAGTSQAAPLVAACAADLFQLRPGARPADIKAALLATRARVTDAKNGLMFPRLDCEQSLIMLDRVFADAFE